MNERLLNLRDQVDQLLQWKTDISRTQIPSDSFGAQSKKIMDIDHLVFTGMTTGDISALTKVSLEVKVGDDAIFLPAAVVTN